MRLTKETLKDKHVMVVGCGALGNEVLKNLALSGVGHIVCVDFDRIEPDNLSRSILFTRADAAAGREKVEAVKERIKEISPETEVTAINADITADVPLGLIRRMDVVVGCVDSRWARLMINRHCMRMDRVWIDGGISLEEGTSRVFAPGRNCYACSLSTEDMAELRSRISCSNIVRRTLAEGKAPTSSITASIVGAVMARETLRVLEGGEDTCGKMFHYDGEAPTCGYASFSAYDEDCPEHEQWSDIETTALDCSCSVAELLAAMPSGSSLLLRDDCFVDYIEEKSSGRKVEVMLPGRKVRSFIESESGLKEAKEYYQHEYKVIDSTFPYRSLTLEQLGIPDGDVLHLEACGKERYFELREK